MSAMQLLGYSWLRLLKFHTLYYPTLAPLDLATKFRTQEVEHSRIQIIKILFKLFSLISPPITAPYLSLVVCFGHFGVKALGPDFSLLKETS